MVWLSAFVAMTGLEFYWKARQKTRAEGMDWLLVVVGSAALAGMIMMIVERVQSRPSLEQRAALSAIFRAGSGTIGAVVVTKNGKPEVVATLRSVDEYVQLAGSGQLPHDHRVYLPDDLV